MPNEFFGVFHEEVSTGIHTPYDVKIPESSRFRGKQMLTHVDVKGKATKESFFDRKFSLTTPGDVYLDPDKVNLEMEKKITRTPPPTTKPFVPTNPSSKSGLARGSLAGTFGPSQQLLDTDSALADRDRMIRSAGPKRPEPRNFFTSPAPQGGDGYPFQFRSIGGTALQHVPDEYLRGRILEKNLRKEARTKIPKPFVGGRASGTFTKDSDLYTNPPLRPASTPPTRPGTSDKGRPRWAPSSPPKKGGGINGMLSPPVYISNPESMRPKTSAAPERVFRPASGRFNRLSIASVNPYYTSPRRKDDSYYFFG